MIEQEVLLNTADGSMSTFVVHPERGGPFPTVAMLMDGQGISDALKDNARTLASAGYFVMLPNLYYRAARSTAVDDNGEIIWDDMRALSSSLSKAKVSADVVVCMDFASGESAAAHGPIGLIGYCMGGRFSLLVSDALGKDVGAVSSIHPGYLATDAEGSPHRNLSNVQAELYIGVAEKDPYLAPGAVEAMRQALQEAGVQHELEVLPGSEHGFAFPGRPHYDRASAFTAWERTFDLFRRNLGSGRRA